MMSAPITALFRRFTGRLLRRVATFFLLSISLGLSSLSVAEASTADKSATSPTNIVIDTELQTTLSDLERESLESAWQIALAQNHQFKARKEHQLAALDQVAEVKAQRLPNLTLSANYLSLDNPPTIQSNFAGIDFTFSYWEQNALYYSVYSSLPLYTSGRIKASLAAATEQADAAQFDTASERQDLKMAVAKAYIDILRANHGLLLAKSHLASLKKHQADVSNLKLQGLVSRGDLLSANVSLANANQTLSRTRNLSELAFAAYNQLLGRELDIKPLLREPEAHIFSNNLDELTLRAMQQREELRALRKRANALQYQATSVKAASKPQVVMGGGYAYQENENQLYEDIWFANVGMVWTLFDGGSTRHRSNHLNRQANALKAQHDNLGELIRLQVRQAWLQIGETRERVEVAQGSIAEAEENLKVTRNRYQEGLSSHTEVLDAETLRIKSRSNHANALYDSILAGLQLERAVGNL